jgi:hypothetical protein
MFLVNTPSTKVEKESHSSIFYGLFENEKMNKWHVTTISHTAENKRGRKQESMNVIASIFDCTVYQSLKNMEVVFFLWMEVCSVVESECGQSDATLARVLMTMIIMRMRLLQSTGNDLPN